MVRWLPRKQIIADGADTLPSGAPCGLMRRIWPTARSHTGPSLLVGAKIWPCMMRSVLSICVGKGLSRALDLASFIFKTRFHGQRCATLHQQSGCERGSVYLASEPLAPPSLVSGSRGQDVQGGQGSGDFHSSGCQCGPGQARSPGGPRAGSGGPEDYGLLQGFQCQDGRHLGTIDWGGVQAVVPT